MYQFKEVRLADDKSVLVISFTDPKWGILGEFLMADASLLDYAVLDKLEKVLAGKLAEVRTSGNRCSAIITKEVCYLEDLLEGMFDDFETFPALELPTREFRDMVLMWKEKQDQFNQANQLQ